MGGRARDKSPSRGLAGVGGGGGQDQEGDETRKGQSRDVVAGHAQRIRSGEGGAERSRCGQGGRRTREGRGEGPADPALQRGMPPAMREGAPSAVSSSGNETTFVVPVRPRNSRFHRSISPSPTTRILRSAAGTPRNRRARRTRERRTSPRKGTGRACCRMLIRYLGASRFTKSRSRGFPGIRRGDAKRRKAPGGTPCRPRG